MRHQARECEGMTDDLPPCCYVCLEEGSAPASGALLVRVCGCRSSAIHAHCMAMLVNSKKNRALPLAERMSCAVCQQPYCIPFGAHVLSARMAPLVRWYKTPVGRIGAPAAFIAASIGAIALSAWLLGQLITSERALRRAWRSTLSIARTTVWRTRSPAHATSHLPLLTRCP